MHYKSKKGKACGEGDEGARPWQACAVDAIPLTVTDIFRQKGCGRCSAGVVTTIPWVLDAICTAVVGATLLVYAPLNSATDAKMYATKGHKRQMPHATPATAFWRGRAALRVNVT